MENCKHNEHSYNRFRPVRNACETMVNYLFENRPLFWKLLYYIKEGQNPYTSQDLTKTQKSKMISKSQYKTNDNTSKNVLFITELSEAFSVEIPQVRFEVGDVVPITPHHGYMYINCQIIVPLTQDILTNTDVNGERRSDAIFLELVDAFNDTPIEGSGFNTPPFMDRSAPNGAGAKTGAYRKSANTNYTQRWVTFSVLI